MIAYIAHDGNGNKRANMIDLRHEKQVENIPRKNVTNFSGILSKYRKIRFDQ